KSIMQKLGRGGNANVERPRDHSLIGLVQACRRIATEIDLPDMRICSCQWVLVVVLATLWSSSRAASDEPVHAVECRERSGLPNVLSKLKAGADGRIAYFGGSITAQNGWRPKTLNWFRQHFPKALVSE